MIKINLSEFLRMNYLEETVRETIKMVIKNYFFMAKSSQANGKI